MMWMDEIQSAIDDEKNDIEKYMRLSEEAEAAGLHEAAAILRDISHDEQTHHLFLNHILDENGE